MDPYRKHAREHRRGGGDIAGIVVEETDGSPSVKNVTKIIVSNGDATDNADGSVTINTGGAAGGAHALTDVNNTVSGRTAGDILVASAATTYAFRQLSGDATMNGTGVVTVAATHSGSAHHASYLASDHTAVGDSSPHHAVFTLMSAAVEKTIVAGVLDLGALEAGITEIIVRGEGSVADTLVTITITGSPNDKWLLLRGTTELVAFSSAGNLLATGLGVVPLDLAADDGVYWLCWYNPTDARWNVFCPGGDSAAATNHIIDATDAHDASAISILDTAADFTATDVEGALAELQADNEAHAGAADPHTGYVLESLIDADGDLIVGSAADTVVRLAKGAADGYKLETRTGTPDLAWTKDYVPLLFIIDGGGATITTGIKGDIYLLENLTIEGWTLLADQSGSIVLDLWQDAYASFPPTVADTITASDKPTIATATKGQDLAPTGWDTTLDAGSVIRVNVDSITSIQRVSLMLHCYRR